MSSSDLFVRRLVREQDRLLAECAYVEKAVDLIDFGVCVCPDRHSKKGVFLIAAAFVALAVALLFVLTAPEAITAELNGSSLPVGIWISAVDSTPRQLNFSDGSRIALQSDTNMRIHKLRPKGAHLLLERGSVDVAVSPRPDADWKLFVGPFVVGVTGTRFTLRWDPISREFSLDMAEGTVRVDGPLIPSGTTLTTGERLHASLINKRLEIMASNGGATDAVSVEPAGEVSVSSEMRPDDGQWTTPDATANDADPDRSLHTARGGHHFNWKALASKGHYALIVASAEKAGVPHVLHTASAVDLLTLGDAARHIGRHRLAERAYKRVRRRFPKTAHASGAAFALGKIAFDRRRAYTEASRWFKACLVDNSGVLEREASGRLMESLRRSGDEVGAGTVATQYLRRYPTGPHALLARQLVGNSGTR